MSVQQYIQTQGCLTFPDVMIEKYSDGHHGSGSRGDGGFHQENPPLVDFSRKTQIIQLRFASAQVGLDQDFPQPDVLKGEK